MVKLNGGGRRRALALWMQSMSRLVGVSPWVDNETLYAIFPSFSYRGKYRSILVDRTVSATSPVIQKPPAVAHHQ
ncbi:hypothetical protein U1Q18_033639 [Sarracenia purpurea var. burkii]